MNGRDLTNTYTKEENWASGSGIPYKSPATPEGELTIAFFAYITLHLNLVSVSSCIAVFQSDQLSYPFAQVFQE